MNVLLLMAMSLDGIIASNDGDEDFLSHLNWQTFSDYAYDYGCFVIGRKTYEAVSEWPDYGFDDFVKETKIVVSRNTSYSLRDGYCLASDPKNALEIARSLGHEKVIVTGGGELNNAFLALRLVTEIVINIEPICAGQGLHVFGQAPLFILLEYKESRIVGEGILQLRYRVIK